MNSLEKFYLQTLKYDLINRFLYNNIKNLPEIKKIVLNFKCTKSDIKLLTSSLLVLKLITQQKGLIIKTHSSNIILKIRKGTPIGCKTVLRNRQIFKFFFILLVEIVPKLKNYDTVQITNNVFSFQLSDISMFSRLKSHYYLFNNLPKLNIIVVTTSRKKKELLFFIKSLLPTLKINFF